uniref:Tetratricopeptide repeat domain containing protein n=1 Tax=Tetraselmis sp. GSL018 TaxID=582737 RepID=A0A061R3X2_9CHLO|mmetsp:Transcript_13386/g.31699  ORF Transcript_13386/g.31699 Transcript_13386/m.31699 type:complete len:358 (-) Transcript_13386:190-1263(-)
MAGFSVLPQRIYSIIHKLPEQLDPEAPKFLRVLADSAATEIWHKHGNFYAHLHDVWQILNVWNQPLAVCRLGLFHSAYSNSFVSMNLFNPEKDRGRLAEMIGDEAENLVYKFCVIDRQHMEDTVVQNLSVPSEGITFRHIRTGEPVHCSAQEIGAFLLETVADYHDQSFGWQSDLEEGRTDALWPGIFKPTLRMSKISRMAYAAAKDCGLQVVPPVFAGCTRVLSPEDERRARDLYWRVVTEEAPRAERLSLLRECASLNPDIAEPHAVAAQIHLQEGRWEEAGAASQAALDIFYQWGTMWDNRMPFEAWVSWCRCMYFQAGRGEWPTTHGGIESLGAVHPSQRYRDLSTSRSMGAK